jgi:NO-binding membrane sensor protein with MHYT domain/signal transduction histidine kinase
MSWYEKFFQIGPIPENAMYGTYDLKLVLLSYLIASFASYVALDMSAHLRKPTTLLFRISWLAGGALIMGAGIWTMHFVGMLSFVMDMPMSYDFYWTTLSMIVAIITAVLAFLFFTIKKPTIKHYILCGILLGMAIPTMHYTGMAAMNGMNIHYKPLLFTLSIIIAIIAAMVAVWLSVQSDQGSFRTRIKLKIGSGLIMGLAIVGMHYTGMFAAVFTEGRSMSHVPLDPTLLSIFVSTIVLCITLVGLVFSTAKHFLTSLLQKDNDFLEAILNHMRGGVVACDQKGTLSLFNKTSVALFGPIVYNTKTIENWETQYPILNINTGKPLKLTEYPLYLALQGSCIQNVEIMMHDTQGLQHILLVDGQPLLGTDGEKLGAVVIFQDITEAKQNAERLLHETQQKEIAQKNLNTINKQLIEAARRAGMAEIATSVLHNIGNIMNSVNVSALSLSEKLNKTHFSALAVSVKLIEEHQHDFDNFVQNDIKGKNVIEYLNKIPAFWDEKKKMFQTELESINNNIKNIKDIIIMQQSMSGGSSVMETLPVVEIIEEALKINNTIHPRSLAKVMKDYQIQPSISTDKVKLLQILVNLLRNAYEVTQEAMTDDKIITVRIMQLNSTNICIEVIDKGLGIAQENLTKIFSYGFTTKKNGHGIGLHTSALSAKELGGSLNASSAGEGRGATFRLVLPFKSTNPQWST